MNLEFFLRYALDRFIKESKNEYFKIVHVTIDDLYIFKTQKSKYMNPETKLDAPIDLIKEYHFGLISREISELMDAVYTGRYYINPTYGSCYMELLNSCRRFVQYRPTLIKERIKQGVKPDDAFYVYLAVEISDILYAKLSKEMAMVATHLNTEEFSSIYDEIKNKEGLVFNFILERYLDLEAYLEKLATNYSDLLSCLTDDKVANFMAYVEYQIHADKKLQNDYTKGEILINANVAPMRFARAYGVLIKFLEVYPTTVTNRNIVTINTGLNIAKIRNIIVNVFNVMNLESNMQYIFNDNYKFIYDDTNDTTNVILRYLHSLILAKPNQFETGDLLNDIIKKDFRFSSRHIMKQLAGDVEAKHEKAYPTHSSGIIESICNRDILGQEVFAHTMEERIMNAITIYEAVSENGETVSEKFSDKVYEIKYKVKKFIIDKKKQKYENLLNEISKDLTLIQSNATEYITVIEKNNLLREAHAIKAELIKIKNKAKSVGDETLMDLISEREDFADDVITLVNKRTIRQERKGTSFKLERDMTDQLRDMNNSNYDKYGDEE